MGKYLKYINKDPILVLTENNDGEQISKDLKVIYNGYWKDMESYMFTDPITKSTFLAKDKNEAKHKLKQLRKSFKDA
jgi:hypothetical protein